ncbi:MAG: hypothetical protein NT022_09600 [Deltaproteobacteria bacterium]|nr:hypothetical protein [Deltaproteobacteria bacterium]
MIKKSQRIFTYVSVMCIAMVVMLSQAYAFDKPINIPNQDSTSYWPMSPTYGSTDKINPSSLKEPLYKRSKKVWPDLPYTDTDINVKALKGLVWMMKFMNTDKHLKGNENNYLTMLGTMYSSARDPYFRRMALEEARHVASKLMSNDFTGRYGDDIDALLDYLSLFNRLGIMKQELQELTFKTLSEKKQNIIETVNQQKRTTVDGDELYDTMLVTYYITNLKQHFPHIRLLHDLPDLRDFMEILTTYKYHLEDEINVNFSTLSSDDIDTIMDDLYNITHVIFVVCDYNSYGVPKKYFQREISYMLKFYDLICSHYHYDPDLLTEVVYVFSLMGYPKDYDIIKKGWITILDSQKEDGSWNAYGIDESASETDKNYDIFHATWVAVDMLVEPVILGIAPFYKPLTKSLEKYADAYRMRKK